MHKNQKLFKNVNKIYESEKEPKKYIKFVFKNDES